MATILITSPAVPACSPWQSSGKKLLSGEQAAVHGQLALPWLTTVIRHTQLQNYGQPLAGCTYLAWVAFTWVHFTWVPWPSGETWLMCHAVHMATFKGRACMTPG